VVDTATAMKNVLRLARADLMVRQLETMYRSMDDQQEGALCLAIVIEQGAERFAINVDQDALVETILADWRGETPADG